MARPGRGPRLRKKRGRANYRIIWTENGRSRERSTGTRDRPAAEAALAAFIQQQHRGAGPRDPAQYGIAEALQVYMSEHAADLRDPSRVGYAVEALLPFWGERRVGDISRPTCRAYGRARGVSDGTLRRDLGVLRAAVNYSAAQGYLTRPVAVALPPKPPGRDRWLTRAEAARLLNAARQNPRTRLYLPLFILLGLYAGGRKGAILGLRWCQVDLVRRRIDFNEPGRPITNKRRPIIPIPRGLLWFLRQARRRGTELGHVISPDGHRITDIKTSFKSACQTAGLADVTPHVLRHTCGTWLAQSGVPLFKIAGWLGHTSDRTTELYAHHSPDHLADARKALD